MPSEGQAGAGGVGGFKKWKCILCGEDVVEGQRFIWVPQRGYAHIECVKARLAASGRLDQDVVALLDASEAVSYAIVRLKAAARLASRGVAEFISEHRRRLEGVAAAVEKRLVEKLEEQGAL